MTRTDLLQFLRAHRLAVEASVHSAGGAQAAVVGIAVADNLEIVFDTLTSTRKARNLERNPRIALVIGGLVDGEERTVQYEGIADRPTGAECEALQRLYLQVFPDGRERLTWPGLVYVRVKPTWIRYTDYRSDPPVLFELDERGIAALVGS